MYYKISAAQEQELLSYPESGMGYQFIIASTSKSYHPTKFLVLNSEFVIESNGSEKDFVRFITSENIQKIKNGAEQIKLSIITVFNESLFGGIALEPRMDQKGGAKENPIEFANGEEVFVRLSAFENDRRVDQIKRCLLPGSYSTTMEDYIKCKTLKLSPLERYALPSNDEIKYAYHIQPKNIDTLQRGIVQWANGKNGGGIEAYFEKGTSAGTFLKTNFLLKFI